jgi:hypothetical protein
MRKTREKGLENGAFRLFGRYGTVFAQRNANRVNTDKKKEE